MSTCHRRTSIASTCRFEHRAYPSGRLGRSGSPAPVHMPGPLPLRIPSRDDADGFPQHHRRSRLAQHAPHPERARPPLRGPRVDVPCARRRRRARGRGAARPRLAQGDRVAAFGKNSDAYVLLWLGSSKAGLVHVPVNFALSGAEARLPPPAVGRARRVRRSRADPGARGVRRHRRDHRIAPRCTTQPTASCFDSDCGDGLFAIARAPAVLRRCRWARPAAASTGASWTATASRAPCAGASPSLMVAVARIPLPLV